MGARDSVHPATKRKIGSASHGRARREVEVPDRLLVAQGEQIRVEANVGGESRQQSSHSGGPAALQ